MKILLPILLVLLAYDQVGGYRILGVFPLNGKSHWVMMEQLMKGLARKGHQVDVVTHFTQKKPIPNYTEISIFGTIGTATNNLTAKEIQMFNSFSLKRLAYMAGDCICELLFTPQLQELIKNPPNDPPYDVVIVELFASPCFLAFGHYLNVPVVGTVASVLHDWLNYRVGNPLNPAYNPSLFSHFTPYMTFWQRLTNTFLTHVVTGQMNYYTDQQEKYVKKAFGPDMPTIPDLYKNMSLVLVNSHHSLHGVRPFTHSIVEVGGLHLHDDDDPIPADVQKWLDESKDGCIYFTFGSMVRIESFSKELMQIFYKSFENIAPVRVLMKIAKPEELIPGLPKNVMTQPWFPQIPVLKHKNIRGFITHGGLMGTTEAIYAGVPMIGIPLFGDQNVNIQTYVRKNVAISLNSIQDVTEKNLIDSLKAILKDPSYRDNIKKLSKAYLDRPMSAVDTAVFWVEYVARNRNALQSPAIQLNWFQRNLFDVYGFLLVCTLLISGVLLFTLCLVLRKIKCLLFGSKTCSRKDGAAAARAKKNK